MYIIMYIYISYTYNLIKSNYALEQIIVNVCFPGKGYLDILQEFQHLPPVCSALRMASYCLGRGQDF